MDQPGVRVEGLNELARNLKRYNAELPKGMREVHRELATPVAADARSGAPVRSGALAASVRAGASPRAAIVSAGARLAYAPVIHWGGYPGDYAGNPWMSRIVESQAGDIASDYEQAMDRFLESVWADS